MWPNKACPFSSLQKFPLYFIIAFKALSASCLLQNVVTQFNSVEVLDGVSNMVLEPSSTLDINIFLDPFPNLFRHLRFSRHHNKSFCLFFSWLFFVSLNGQTITSSAYMKTSIVMEIVLHSPPNI